MGELAWVCSNCRSSTAAFLCCCSVGEVFICKPCLSVHYEKNKGRVHSCIPLSAYGQHTSPGYFDRLNMRSRCLGQLEADAQASIASIDQCISKFQSRISSLISGLESYCASTVSHLQSIKHNLEIELDRGLHSLLATFYLDKVDGDDEWVRKLRGNVGAVGEFSLFRYTIEDTDVLDRAQNLLKYEVGLKWEEEAPKAIESPCLPSIVGDRFVLFSTDGNAVQQATLAISFHAGTVLVSAGGLVYFLGGGSAEAYSLDLKTIELMKLANMRTARGFFGAWADVNVIYVFGGYRYWNNEKASEKYSFEAKNWTQLPNMTHGRAYFTPCKFRSELYLPCASNLGIPIEIFDIASESFRIASISLPNERSSLVSFAVEDEIIVLSLAYKKKLRYLPKDTEEKEFRMALYEEEIKKDLREANCCGMAVTIGKKVSWVDFNGKGVHTFDLDTNKLA